MYINIILVIIVYIFNNILSFLSFLSLFFFLLFSFFFLLFSQGMLDTLWGHQVISQPLYEAYKEECTDNPDQVTCWTLEYKILDSIGKLNMYALDWPVCGVPSMFVPSSSSSLSSLSSLSSKTSQSQYENNSKYEMQNYMNNNNNHRSAKSNHQSMQLLNHIFKSKSISQQNKMNSETEIVKEEVVQQYEPCSPDYLSVYLNNPNVKEALHVKDSIIWQQCSE